MASNQSHTQVWLLSYYRVNDRAEYDILKINSEMLHSFEIMLILCLHRRQNKVSGNGLESQEMGQRSSDLRYRGTHLGHRGRDLG